MLKEKRISKKKTIILVLILVVMLMIIIYFIFGNFFSLNGSGGPESDQNVGLLIVPSVKTDFAADFLIKKPYKDLRGYGSPLAGPGLTGRKNPFSEVLFSPAQ